MAKNMTSNTSNNGGARLKPVKAIKQNTQNVSPLIKPSKIKKDSFQLDAAQLLKIHDLMIKTRCLEERLIKMYKQSDGYFWIGGPGEEAFQIPLGLQAKKGQGKDFDYFHLHYRGSGIMVSYGMEPIDAIRQMKNVAADPFSGGRNFGNHFSRRKWNITPTTSTIETQYQPAIGTAMAQKRHGGDGITIVMGGDAGTAEGDFPSCLVWSSRPGNELPIFITVQNNYWGISTAASTQHGEDHISDRGKAFNIRSKSINGNDVEESWFEIKEAMEYIRTERKPFLMETRVSRLYGHSSASGANFHSEEEDPINVFEAQLGEASILSPKEATQLREKYTQEFLEIAQKVKLEPMPDPSGIYDFTYHNQKGKYW